MFGFVTYWIGILAIVGVVAGTVLARGPGANSGPVLVNRPSSELGRGQYGGDLQVLRSFCTVPEEGESNFFLDLWEPGNLARFARGQGLTNNNALLIDSHGSERLSWKGLQFVFRPGPEALSPDMPTPMYSIRDIATVLGPAAPNIHNLVIAGCNEGGALAPAAFRRYFVNATNVTYMAAGQRSYKPQFYQVLTQHSEDLEQLYEKVVSMEERRVRSEILRTPVKGARKLGWYMSDLFRPGESKPFRRQRAGRELLEPGTVRSPGLRVDRGLEKD